MYLATEGGLNRLLWHDRSGTNSAPSARPPTYGSFSIFPDGQRIAFDLVDPQSENRDVWIYNLEREVASRFTFHEAPDYGPLWSPDSSRIVFASERVSPGALFIKEVPPVSANLNSSLPTQSPVSTSPPGQPTAGT